MEVAEVSDNRPNIYDYNEVPITVQESSGTLNQETSVAQTDVEGCSGTQVGSRDIFYGPVDVSHTLEVTGNQQVSPPTSLGFSNPVDFLPIQGVSRVISEALRRQPSSTGINWATVDNILGTAHTSIQSESTSLSEQRPLLGKGNTKIRVKYFALLVVICITLIVIVILTAIYGHITTNNDDNLPTNFTHIFRSRNNWGALPPKHAISNFKYMPPKFVIVSHTASHSCTTPAKCSVAIRNIQAGQMAALFDDIAFDFLVAGDGLIYEGRGWKKRSASVHGMGCSSLAVAFVGHFTEVLPPKDQIDAFALLLETGANYGRLMKNYKMFMQSDIIKTESPGKPLSDLLRKWPHWQPFGSEYFVCNGTTT